MLGIFIPPILIFNMGKKKLALFLLIMTLSIFFLNFKKYLTHQTVVLIGLDGATFDIILPLIRDGRLPNFAKLLEKGSWGNLTCIPPSSPIQWTSIITGTKPEKHGMFNFGYLKDKNFVAFNISWIRTKPLWRLLSDRDKKVGIIDWLFSWPTEKVNGFMVALTYHSMSPTPATYPENLVLPPYPPQLTLKSKLIEGNFTEDEYIDFVTIIEEYKQKVFFNLQKAYKVDFLAYVSYLPDEYQHRYWLYMEPQFFDVKKEEANKYGDVIERGYKLLDEFLGNFIDNEEITLIVVSDHGFQRGDIVGGPILVKELKPPLRAYMYIIFRVNYLLNKIGFLSFDDRYETINFSETKAYFCNNFTFIGICINSENEKEKERLQMDVISKLNKVVFENGERVFTEIKAIKNENELEPSIIFTLHPDLFVEKNFIYNESAEIIHAFDKPPNIQYVVINNSKIKKILLDNFTFDVSELIDFFNKYGGSGRHAKNGIIILYGKNIKKGIINSATPVDIAPTILYLLQQPIPKYMDGRVLIEAIKDDYLQKNPIRYCEEEEKYEAKVEEISIDARGFKIIEEQLKKLGY